MKQNLTDLTIIIDRSGSMDSCATEASNGINQLIEDQKKQSGECLATLVQFDTSYEFVHKGIQIVNVPKYTLVPRGMTALFDAVGRSINEAGDRLAKMREEDRPGLVVFVIVTDGLENSSHEFTGDQIRAMIERQQKDYNWKFTYLGANQDAFAAASNIGIPIAAAAPFKPGNVKKAYAAASSNVRRMREAVAVGAVACSSYTDEERDEMEK
jgi:hypothetical protein